MKFADAPITLKILALVAVSSAVPFLFSIHLIRSNVESVETFRQDVEMYATVNSIQASHRGMLDRLGAFLESGTSEELNRYNEGVDAFVFALKRLERIEEDDETAFLLHSIWNSFGSWYDEAHAAIRRRLAAGDDYYSFYYRAERISRYLDIYISQVLDRTLVVGTETYRARLERTRMARNLSIAFLAVFGFASAVLGVFFSGFITRPIKRLVEAARQMAAAEGEAAALPVESSDEIGALTDSFNAMSTHISALIRDLKEKAAIEERLRREELRNALIDKQRREAEFLALQARINPHFLFNSLNIISRDILLRDGRDAIELIGSLSSLLRYGLEQGSGVVSLATELEIIRKYAFIQKYRFEDRIHVSIDCRLSDPEAVKLPAFSVQPLVENALIHGVEPKTTGGRIEVEAFARGGSVVVRVSDDGIGMDEARMRTIKASKELAAGGHTSAIGLSNVRDRLRLYTGDRRCFSIRSREGGGTVVEFRLREAIV